MTPPTKLPLAPLRGAAKVTIAPGTEFPVASFTVTTSGDPNEVPMPALWGVPLVAVMNAGAEIVKVKAAVAVCGGILLSVTVNPSERLATVAIGVPLIRPVEPFSVSPLGNDPELSCQVYRPIPPVADKVWEYAAFTKPAGSDVVVTFNATGPPAIVRARVTLADCASGVDESVTLNVSEAFARATPGVPLITPVKELSTSPPGSVPEMRDHVKGDVPPFALKV